MDDIQVISVDPTTHKVIFGIKPKRLNGISKLVQLVVLSLLNSPGRDIFDPGKGSGLLSLTGSNIDPQDNTEIFADIAQRVKKTEQEIINAQLGSNDSPEEKLRELQIISIQRGDSVDDVAVTIRVINELGQSFALVL